LIAREDKDSISTLRLAHRKASALDIELLEAINTELDSIEASDARALILTGTGSIFSAGVDLFRIVESTESHYVGLFLALLNRTIERLFSFPLPTIAAVNGHAIAGGCILVQACDYRLMSRDGGRIGTPELLVGVPFPPAALEILRFTVAPSHLQRVIYSGETFSTVEALSMGLIDEGVAKTALMDRAATVATQFAALPRETFRTTKRELRRSTVERFDKLASDSGGEIARIWSSPETKEGIRAYLAKTVRKGK